jgi:pyruvyl transferase EpsO
LSTPEPRRAPARDHARLLSDGLHAWIPPGSDVAIVDVPVHRNAGDFFIYAVTEWLLRERGCRVVYRAGVRDYRSSAARRAIGRDAIVVGLGGGNFGDLYPQYQALRERVLGDFPSNRIVVLPQSIHFARPDALSQSLATLHHADLRIAVRDVPSLAIARTITPHVQLLPDVVDAAGAALLSAAGIGASPAAHEAAGTLRLLRRDGERARGDDGPGRRTPAGGERDWPALLPGFYRTLALATLLMPAAPRAARARLHAWWLDVARASLLRAVEAVRRADHVVTDRLHGAIVARLAGRPVTLVDNSYGKLSAYYDAWWSDDPRITLARRVGPPGSRHGSEAAPAGRTA